MSVLVFHVTVKNDFCWSYCTFSRCGLSLTYFRGFVIFDHYKLFLKPPANSVLLSIQILLGQFFFVKVENALTGSPESFVFTPLHLLFDQTCLGELVNSLHYHIFANLSTKTRSVHQNFIFKPSKSLFPLEVLCGESNFCVRSLWLEIFRALDTARLVVNDELRTDT